MTTGALLAGAGAMVRCSPGDESAMFAGGPATAAVLLATAGCGAVGRSCVEAAGTDARSAPCWGVSTCGVLEAAADAGRGALTDRVTAAPSLAAAPEAEESVCPGLDTAAAPPGDLAAAAAALAALMALTAAACCPDAYLGIMTLPMKL